MNNYPPCATKTIPPKRFGGIWFISHGFGKALKSISTKILKDLVRNLIDFQLISKGFSKELD